MDESLQVLKDEIARVNTTRTALEMEMAFLEGLLSKGIPGSEFLGADIQETLTEQDKTTREYSKKFGEFLRIQERQRINKGLL